MRQETKLRSGQTGLQTRSLISILTLMLVQFCVADESERLRLTWSRLTPLPEKAGLGGCFVGVSGDALLVAGGCNFPDKKIWEGGQKAWLDKVHILTTSDGEWRRAGRLPHPLAYGVSATTTHGLVCIGGADTERHHAEVLLLRWSGRDLETRPLPSLPTPLAYATGTVVRDIIYVAGGTTTPAAASASDSFLALDLSRKEHAWQELKPCPGKPRMLAVAGALDGVFYIAGGVTLESANGNSQRRYLRDVWRYRPSQGWQRLANLPRPCSAGATPAPYFGSTLYVVGGDDGSLVGFQPMGKHPGFSKGILAYDTTSNMWRNEDKAPVPNATVQTAFWQGRFVFPAGEPGPGLRSAEVWALDISAGK